jgi:hypothetical protein
MPTFDETRISRVLEEARRKLLDTGTRNRLVHVNRANPRSNSLNLIQARADEIYRILRVEGKRMQFRARGEDGGGEYEEIQISPRETPLKRISSHSSERFIETPLGSDALERRLLRLANDAKTAEEEQGVNIRKRIFFR